MNELTAVTAGLVAALPLFGMVWFWERHPRRRPRGAFEAVGAIAASVLLLVLAGALIDATVSSALMIVPLVIGGMVMALSLNRMVQEN